MTELTARYEKAEALLPGNLKKLISSPQVKPVWIGQSDVFWYRNQTADGVNFVQVDAEQRTKRPAFDHERLAGAVRDSLDIEVDASALPFTTIELVGKAVRFVAEEKRIEVSLESYRATILGPAHSAETPSPDGRWAVGATDHNLYLRNLETDEVRQLTDDGTRDYEYGASPDASAGRVLYENFGLSPAPLVVWAPDSSRFVTYRLDQRALGLMHLVRSVPKSGGRPELLSYRYAVVEDEQLPKADYFVFDVGTGESRQAECEPVLMDYVSPIALGFVWWRSDSDQVYWLANTRDGKTASLHSMDPSSGEVQMLVEESGPTHVMHGPQLYDRNVRVLDTGEVVWWSERTGWGHLYLYAPDGAVTPLTSGDWLVRKVVLVDEQARRVVFTAAGREPGTDIYLQEIYALSLDGGEITPITADGLDHDTRTSPTGRYFVDVVSRYDTPGASVLRDARGEIVSELEEADATALYEAGWSKPERVVVKAADGVTDIYCEVYTPHDFDPSKRYPIVDEIYPGPQISTTRLRFPLTGGVLTAQHNAPCFAALGFVVVSVDARGTAMRHRAFQDHARLGGHGDFVEDHEAAIRQLAETRPWMDLNRVGIFGHSGGGYASTRAILQAPDFFKVAVSSAGDHDNSIYHSWWGERFYGSGGSFDFAGNANATRAANLKGKLLLAHGGMDDNVTPHQTLRVVDALIEADKDFDLIIVPNADHSMYHQHFYWLRRRWDYFVRHLLGRTPPKYNITPIPPDPEMLASL